MTSDTRGMAQAAGYTYVNSDDCWMLANRGPEGQQVANPSKFPAGFAAVASAIHALGLKSGLYTAKGTHTCGGYAASCNHEAQDALQWASWGERRVGRDRVAQLPNPCPPQGSTTSRTTRARPAAT